MNIKISLSIKTNDISNRLVFLIRNNHIEKIDIEPFAYLVGLNNCYLDFYCRTIIDTKIINLICISYEATNFNLIDVECVNSEENVALLNEYCFNRKIKSTDLPFTQIVNDQNIFAEEISSLSVRLKNKEIKLEEFVQLNLLFFKKWFKISSNSNTKIIGLDKN